MADILLQNAIAGMSQEIRAASSKINYAAALGVSLQEFVKTLLTASASNGPFTSVSSAPTAFICDLSDLGKISSPNCNYSGSTTSSVAPNSPWTNGTVLKGFPAVSASQSDIVTKIKALNPTLNSIWAESNTVVGNDIYLAYLGVKKDFLASNATAVLQNWYGVGISTLGGQGAPLTLTNRVKVCGTTWQCGQGAACTWTVPTGASKAKFQVWGAGHGSNSACCCGGASFATTGAYAEMVLNVTPGTQYSVCAGCSCARMCCSNNPPGCGCMSGVTGPGICCLKADGAGCFTDNCDDLNYVRCVIGAGSACARFQSPTCTGSGPCWCNYGEYCYDNSCSTCGIVPVYPACCRVYACSCATPAAADKHGPQYVMFGLHGGGCLDTNNYGYHIRPPIIDADTGVEFTGGCRCQTFSSGNCCGGCNAINWTNHPGLGGAGTHMMGGATDHQGDIGKGGMVQISWI